MGKEVSKIVDKYVDPIMGYAKRKIKPLGRLYDIADTFTENVVKGIGKNVLGMVEGIVSGNWTKFRDSTLGIVTTAAFIVTAIFGGPVGIAAAVVGLDAQYNQGQLTFSAVKGLGVLEKKLFGSDNIQRHAEEIALAIILASAAYTAYTVQGLNLLSGFNSLINAYTFYKAYKDYEAAKDLYDNLMKQYKEWLEKVNQALEKANKIWDYVYGNLEVWVEAMPGGYLFNSGVGSDEYSISSIHEQCAYSLMLDTKKDDDLDMMVLNPSEINWVKLNIEDIKPKAINF